MSHERDTELTFLYVFKTRAVYCFVVLLYCCFCLHIQCMLLRGENTIFLIPNKTRYFICLTVLTKNLQTEKFNLKYIQPMKKKPWHQSCLLNNKLRALCITILFKHEVQFLKQVTSMFEFYLFVLSFNQILNENH